MNTTETKNPKSLGECRVRVEFNPSAVGNVNFIKEKTAELINVCDDLRAKEGVDLREKVRLIKIAQKTYEEAAMWAVKAATF